MNILNHSGETSWNFRYRIWSDIDNDYWKQFQDKKEKNNLLYNGDFNFGTMFWGSNDPSSSLTSELLEHEGFKFMRLHKISGAGNYQLLYSGREVHYYAGLTYTLKFKYRVIKGNDIPFFVGWWSFDNGLYRHNLEPKIAPLGKGWNQCEVNYTFTSDHDNLPLFINSQLPNSIIDIGNIIMYCNDTTKSPMFTRQIFNSYKSDRNFVLPDVELISKERTERWSYAYMLWIRDYSIFDKTRGKGFEYLKQFGKEFYPNECRLDYPHNPVISSLLYSGIVGCLYYICILILSIFYYWQWRKDYSILFVLYLVVLFFMMVSGNSHFSVPIFTFLSFIPFAFKNTGFLKSKSL
jgi:hypothetical protein